MAYVDVQRLRGQPFLERLVAPFTRDPYSFQRPGASALGAIAFYGFFEGFPDWSLMLADGDFDLGDGPADLETFRYVGFSPSHVVYRPMLDSFGRVVPELPRRGRGLHFGLLLPGRLRRRSRFAFPSCEYRLRPPAQSPSSPG